MQKTSQKAKLSWWQTSLLVMMTLFGLGGAGLKSAHAQPAPAAGSTPSFIGELTAPPGMKIGSEEITADNVESTLATTIDWVLNLAFGIAVLLVLGNIIAGAYQWITSGGKSDKIKAGRDRIIWAVVGLFLVAAAYGITVLVQGLFIENGGQLQVDLLQPM